MRIFLYTLTAWNEAPRARHQVTYELLKQGHQVFFIEKNRWGFPRLSYKSEDHLTIITPYFLPGYKFRYRLPLISGLFQNWIFRKLKNAFGDPLIITFDYTAHRLRHFFSRVIYYCNDEHIGNDNYPNPLVDAYHRRCEQILIRHARVNITTSPFLTRKLSQMNPIVYEIPLGGPDPESIPPRIRRSENGSIVVGLVGFITLRNISYRVINQLLQDERIFIRFVGTVDESFLKKITDMTRITLMGVLRDEAFYAAIREFDVAVIPYDLDILNPGATPNKLYQYLACGIPVVMTSMSNMQNRSFPEGTVYQSKGNSDFLELVHKAHHDDSPEMEHLRRQVAAENSWEKRVSEFLEILRKNGLTGDEDGRSAGSS